MEKAKMFQKNIYFWFINYDKAFDYMDHNKLWKMFRDSNTRPSYLPRETCTQVKKQHSELDMEQWTGLDLGKEYVKAIYCHPDYLTYMQSTSCEILCWINHKLESRL